MLKLKRLGATAVVAVALTLTGCAGSANATACKLYEDAYNQMADAVRLKADGLIEAEDVQAEVDALPARFADAYEKAQGDVAVAMRASVESALASNAAPDNEDIGVVSFMDMTSVEEACAADGAPIDRHEMSD